MPEHPKLIGDRTTAAIMLALVDAGFDVSVPFGENCRYDLVVDRDGRLTRVQCKTGRLRNGAVRFATASSYGHHATPKAARRDYLGQIDEFGVYCPETAGVYLVPIGDVRARCTAHLRVEPSRNSQRSGVRAATDYAVTSVRVGRHPREPTPTPSFVAGVEWSCRECGVSARVEVEMALALVAMVV